LLPRIGSRLLRLGYVALRFLIHIRAHPCESVVRA
jgi:hypothetical protein